MPAPIPRVRVHDGRLVDQRGAPVAERRAALDGDHEVGLGDDLAVDRRHGGGAHDRPAPAAERDLELEPIARHDLAAELGVVHAAQPRAARRTGPGCRHSSSVATCVSDSIISTPGMSGVPGKWPWKNSSLTVTFLTATMRRPGS